VEAINLKTILHKLIDKIQSEQLLMVLYDFLKFVKKINHERFGIH
jgi:hypothetical protein